jgi:hypothetical protein
MKTIKTFFIATLLFSLTANSQITKGNWMVGGSGSFKSISSESIDPLTGEIYLNSNKELHIDPNIGYFIMNKLSLGMKFGFSLYIPDSEAPNSKYYTFGPFLRYYFLKEEKNINIFLEPSYERILKYDSSVDNASNSFNFKLGNVIFLNESVGLETSLTYSILKSEGFKNKTLTLGIGLQIHLKKNR